MKRIPLTRGYFALVDDSDYESLSQYKWRASVNHSRGQRVVYACRRSPMVNAIPGKIIYMHRQILALTNRSELADHIDYDGLNNQRHNLRVCSASQNGYHQRRGSNRGVGTHPQSPRFRARISVNGSERHLGMFDTIKDAQAAYEKAAKKYFGEFASCLA